MDIAGYSVAHLESALEVSGKISAGDIKLMKEHRRGYSQFIKSCAKAMLDPDPPAVISTIEGCSWAVETVLASHYKWYLTNLGAIRYGSVPGSSILLHDESGCSLAHSIESTSRLIAGFDSWALEHSPIRSWVLDALITGGGYYTTPEAVVISAVKGELRELVSGSILAFSTLDLLRDGWPSLERKIGELEAMHLVRQRLTKDVDGHPKVAAALLDSFDGQIAMVIGDSLFFPKIMEGASPLAFLANYSLVEILKMVEEDRDV